MRMGVLQQYISIFKEYAMEKKMLIVPHTLLEGENDECRHEMKIED